MDSVVVGGTVVDGTGRPPRVADVVVRDGRVDAIVEPGASLPAETDVQTANCLRGNSTIGVARTGPLLPPPLRSRLQPTRPARQSSSSQPLE